MTGSYTYPFPAHYLTTDIAAFTFKAAQLQVLLIERGQSPFKGSWALPGGFLKPDEELDACARRELAEETSLKAFFLEQFATIGTVDRDPRGRVITVAYVGLVRWEDQVRGGSDASDARWFPIDELPRLAFDHGELIKLARLRLERMVVEQPMLLLRFLPEEFTIEQMQAVQDAVLARSPERRSFYRRATEVPSVELRAMTIPSPAKKRR